MAVFDSNVPRFFTEREFEDFKKWLDGRDDREFFVLKDEEQILGFGGFYIGEESARLVWGVVHADEQGQGYGRILTEHRIERIRELRPGIRIGLETSQLTYRFFERFGFRTVEIVPGHYEGRFDKYEMVMQG